MLALGEAMAGRFVITTIAPETLSEGGILAVFGVTVDFARGHQKPDFRQS